MILGVWLLGILSLGLAAFVAMWFLRAERFYRIRESVRHIRAAELTRRRKANDPAASTEWKKVLVDARKRTGVVNLRDVLKRVYFIREQYYLNDTIEGDRLGENVSVPVGLGLIELCDIIEKLARNMKKEPTYIDPIVSADELLTAMLSAVRDKAALRAADRDQTLKAFGWLHDEHPADHVLEHIAERPISVEQATELLIAVAIALAVRTDRQGLSGGVLARAG